MRGVRLWVGALARLYLLPKISSANPLTALEREHWVSLDSTATDQTTDVATGAGGTMVYISGYRQETPAAVDGLPSIEARLMAYNSSGVRQWVAEFGSSGEDLANSVAADGTGVYLAGTESIPRNSSSSGAGGGDDLDHDTDAFVVKYNSTGGVLWKTSWGTSEPDLGNGVAVDDGSGLVYVVGTTRGLMTASGQDGGEGQGGEGEGSTGGASTFGSASDAPGATEDNAAGVQAGMSDVFLTCLDATDGGIRWTRQFGSSSADVGNRVAVGPRGGVFVVGQLGDDEDPSLAGARAFLAKYDYLGNAQFTARLNSSSAHYAVDLAPSAGSGGEGVVYMSGYTLGDSPLVFLARFEGSTGTQTWLSHLGEESGMPHLAQSVVVVEGSQDGFGGNAGVRGGGGAEGAVPGSDMGGGTPVVEGEGGVSAGEDARIVVVGYNTSAASASSHSSTGFTATADTNGNWASISASLEADRHTAIAIGSGATGQQQGYGSESFAFIVGTVAASEASPGNYLFLDIQRVVREGMPTPAPTVDVPTQKTSSPRAVTDPAGGASSTTGLSQGSSLWLLIIAPIVVVLSCILTVSYVSKQCAIAFGTRDHHHGGVGDGRGGMDAIDFGRSDGRNLRSLRSFRRAKGSSSGWNEGASASPSNTSIDRRRRRDGGGGNTEDGLKVAWPRSVAAAFRDRVRDGPPYRKLAARERRGNSRDEADVQEGRGKRSSAPASPLSVETGEVELRQVPTPFDYPARESGSVDGSVCGGGEGQDNLAGVANLSQSDTVGEPPAAAGWDVFEDVQSTDDGEGHGGRGRSHITGNPRGDEPTAGGLLYSEEARFGVAPSGDGPRELL